MAGVTTPIKALRVVAMNRCCSLLLELERSKVVVDLVVMVAVGSSPLAIPLCTSSMRLCCSWDCDDNDNNDDVMEVSHPPVATRSASTTATSSSRARKKRADRWAMFVIVSLCLLSFIMRPADWRVVEAMTALPRILFFWNNLCRLILPFYYY